MLTTSDGKLAVHWWTHAPNFGDLLAPWLASRMSGREVGYAPRGTPGYVVIGSILGHVSDGCVVWGAGSFGTEVPAQVNVKAEYLAVRGPLTRNKLDNLKVACPRIYGDPALLVPDYYNPDIERTHEVGVVLRWSEHGRNKKMDIAGVKKIYLGSDDIEGTLNEMLSCKRIVSSSLHGLILADAYGIPNAWLDSPTPKGREFKYWDYLISVDKPRQPQAYKLVQPGLTAQRLIDDLYFDDRPIRIDLDQLRDACPFMA
jgi:pyruvyltransferase